MHTGGAEKSTAVLIDGDNVSATVIRGLMMEVVKYGNASVRRIYGDFTSPQMKSWRDCLLEHSIVPVQQFAYTAGKNATDGAMIIDAMDLLYTGRFSSFCLVSSDSDFTRLAARIREQGLSVYGFGNRSNTHRALVAACNEFVYFDVLPNQPMDWHGTQASPLSQTPTQSKVDMQARQLRDSQKVNVVQTEHRSYGSPPPTSAFLAQPKRDIDEAALRAIRTVLIYLPTYADDEDFVNLADVGAALARLAPDINARNYGFQRLREFVEASGIVELKMKTHERGPPIALVRLIKR